MDQESETNWAMLAKMRDQDIDLTEMSELDDIFFNQAELHIPANDAVGRKADAGV
jgi:hypothetical protein